MKHPRMDEQAQMFGNVCLSGVGGFDDLSDRARPGTEALQNFEAHWLTEYFEKGGNALDFFEGKSGR